MTPLNFVASALSGIAGLFGGPLFTNTPTTPVAPPVIWAVIAFARNQFQQSVSLAPPTSGCACASGLVSARWGTATCQADGIGSFAIAIGEGSSAVATGGDYNTAFAWGTNASAHSADGSFNTARAIGDDSLAKAGVTGDPNDNNTAIAINGGHAFAGSGGNENDGNTAYADGAGSVAEAGTEGDENDNNLAVALDDATAPAPAPGVTTKTTTNRSPPAAGSLANSGISGLDNDGNTALANAGVASAGTSGNDQDDNSPPHSTADQPRPVK